MKQQQHFIFTSTSTSALMTTPTAMTMMLMMMITTTTLLMTPSSYVEAAASQLKTAKFNRLTFMDNYILTGPPASGAMNDTVVARRSNVTYKSQCAALCLSVESCVSFFHDDDDAECVLHSVLYLGADEAAAKPGTTYWQLYTDDCPQGDGYVLYRPLGLCYKYYDQSVVWDTAQSTCNSTGTSLLKVDTPEVFQHMYHFLRGSTATRVKHVSIGASEKTGTLVWQDGTPVTWVHWMAPNEPSSSSENCVTMAWFYYFKWNDVPCSSDTSAAYNFICQKTI